MTGLVPIAHPPGSEILASLYFESIGPRVKIEALIVLTNAYSAVKLVSLEELMKKGSHNHESGTHSH